ncbi:MAG: hypothetical protein ACOZCO_09250 [Bacteroidota bacterium]
MKRIFVLILFLSFCELLFSQRDSTSRNNRKDDENDLSEMSFLERSYWGGNAGAYFTSSGSYLEISPIFGYNLTRYFSVGLTTTYKFYKTFQNYAGLSYSTHVFGGGPYARFILFDFLFAQAEAEMLNTEVYDVVKRDYVRKFIPITSAGLGLKSRSEGSYSYFMVLYDFTHDNWSPYPTSPIIIKAGVVFPVKMGY